MDFCCFYGHFLTKERMVLFGGRRRRVKGVLTVLKQVVLMPKAEVSL